MILLQYPWTPETLLCCPARLVPPCVPSAHFSLPCPTSHPRCVEGACHGLLPQAMCAPVQWHPAKRWQRTELLCTQRYVGCRQAARCTAVLAEHAGRSRGGFDRGIKRYMSQNTNSSVCFQLSQGLMQWLGKKLGEWNLNLSFPTARRSSCATLNFFYCENVSSAFHLLEQRTAAVTRHKLQRTTLW